MSVGWPLLRSSRRWKGRTAQACSCSSRRRAFPERPTAPRRGARGCGGGARGPSRGRRPPGGSSARRRRRRPRPRRGCAARRRRPSVSAKAGEARGVGAAFGEEHHQGGGALEVELALPEQLEGAVVVGAEDAVVLRVEHADVGELGVEDLARAADGEAAQVGLAAAVHVAVLDAPPLVRVARLLGHGAVGGDLGAAEVGRDVQRVGQPDDAGAGVALEIVGRGPWRDRRRGSCSRCRP